MASGNKGGAKSSYKPEFAEQARRLAEQFNATDEDIAAFFGKSARTILRWKLEHSDFAEAMEAGKKAPDQRVKDKLYQRAVGYDYVAEEVFQYQGKIIRAKVVKHVPPNVTAQIYWTRNRCRNEFPDVRGTGPGGDDTPVLNDPDSDIP